MLSTLVLSNEKPPPLCVSIGGGSMSLNCIYSLRIDVFYIPAFSRYFFSKGESVAAIAIFKISPGKKGRTAEVAACKKVVCVKTESQSVPKDCKKRLPIIMPRTWNGIE